MTYSAQFFYQGPRMEVAGMVVLAANAAMLLVLALMGWRCAAVFAVPWPCACAPRRQTHLRHTHAREGGREGDARMARAAPAPTPILSTHTPPTPRAHPRRSAANTAPGYVPALHGLEDVPGLSAASTIQRQVGPPPSPPAAALPQYPQHLPAAA
jgi:hypothetical protein